MPDSATLAAHAARVEAARDWRDHQPDRAWIEYGFRWPPLSVRRPRCLACAQAWPCPVALATHEHLIGRQKYRQTNDAMSEDR
jgi:hypothetical protein